MPTVMQERKHYRDLNLYPFLKECGCVDPEELGFFVNETYMCRSYALFVYILKNRFWSTYLKNRKLNDYLNLQVSIVTKACLPVFLVFYNPDTVDAWHIVPQNRFAREIRSEYDMPLKDFLILHYEIRSLPVPDEENLNQAVKEIQKEEKNIWKECNCSGETFKRWIDNFISVFHHKLGDEIQACDNDLTLADGSLLEFKERNYPYIDETDFFGRKARTGKTAKLVKQSQLDLARRCGNGFYLIKYNDDYTRFGIGTNLDDFHVSSFICSRNGFKKFLQAHGEKVIW